MGKTIKRPTKVKFITKDGKEVSFKAVRATRKKRKEDNEN